MATWATRLQKVRDAIDEVLDTGQSISQDGRALTMANLKELREMEKEYEKRAAQEAKPKAGRNRVIYVKPIV